MRQNVTRKDGELGKARMREINKCFADITTLLGG